MTDCGTDQRLIAAHRDFDWPCEKRRAHGPHWVPREMPDDLTIIDGYDCPGVKAHPATQIGRVG